MEPLEILYECDLLEPVSTKTYNGTLNVGEDGTHIFNVECRSGGKYERITDPVTGLVKRSDGEVIRIDGSTEGNIAIVRLSADSCAVAGPIYISIIVGEKPIMYINATVEGVN